jgi:hypothetical protein
MNRTISLISAKNGKPKYVIALKLCKCSKCKTAITSSQKCVDVPIVKGAHANTRRYCLNCFRFVLEKTTQDIEQLKKGLE